MKYIKNYELFENNILALNKYCKFLERSDRFPQLFIALYEYNNFLYPINIMFGNSNNDNFIEITKDGAYNFTIETFKNDVEEAIDFYKKRPQFNEKLTKQIEKALSNLLNTDDYIHTYEMFFKKHINTSYGESFITKYRDIINIVCPELLLNNTQNMFD